MTLLSKLIDLFASGFYSGYSPVASGTAGSGVGLILISIVAFLAPDLLTSIASLSICALLTLFAVWIAHLAVVREIYGAGNKDPQRIVIDEIAGMFCSVALLPLTPTTLGLAFFFFRLFDVLKPFPANRFEKLPTGWGIVMDDIAAGIYANIVMQVILVVIA